MVQILFVGAMRLLPLMLLIVYCSASAKWELLEKQDSPPLHRYIDLDNVVKSGQLRRVWTVINYSQELAGTLSIRTYTELDCQERKSRFCKKSHFPNIGQQECRLEILESIRCHGNFKRPTLGGMTFLSLSALSDVNSSLNKRTG